MQSVEDEKVKDKISEEDRKTVVDKCEETIKWLDENQEGTKEEYDAKQKEVEVICQEVCLVECLVECQEECLVILEMLKEVLDQPLKKLINFVIHMRCSICLYYHKEIVSWNV